MDESVFAYRAPDDEDKAHLQVLQTGFIEMERVVNAVISGGERQLGVLEAQVAIMRGVIGYHVPAGNERNEAHMRLIRVRQLARDNAGWQDSAPWEPVWVALRECRQWSNAGVMLA